MQATQAHAAKSRLQEELGALEAQCSRLRDQLGALRSEHVAATQALARTRMALQRLEGQQQDAHGRVMQVRRLFSASLYPLGAGAGLGVANVCACVCR
jgi:chromosome segregation ATPase